MQPILVCQWGRRGGGPKIALELARALSRRGDVRAHLTMSRQAEIFPQALASGLPLLAVDTYSGPWSAAGALLRLPGFRRRFRRLIEEAGVGTVLVAMPHLWNSFVLDAARAAGCRIVTVVHDADAHPGDSYPLRDRLMAREIAASDRLVALTRHVADRAAEKYGFPRQRISIIPHGVFRFGQAPVRRRRLPAGRPFRFMLFGRLLPYKGLNLLVEALDRIDPAVPVEVVVAGSGDPGALLGRLERHPRLRLDRRWIPEAEMPALLDQADALVLPYREASQSGSLAAAIGAGLPTIATPVGGLREQIEPYGAGIVIEAPAPWPLAHAMTRLATDAQLYDSLVAGTLRAAEGPLSWDAIAGRFVDVVRDF